MPNTITGFNTFGAGTKARATEVNQNFSNFRGDIIPINESTITASDGVHNLGGTGHEWLNIYLSNNPYVNGVQMQALPPGVILPFSGLSASSGFLICDGSLVSRVTYANLFGIIGEHYGEGDLSTTFAIPDLQGRFIRGLDDGAGRDPDALSRTSAMTAFTLTATVVANTTVVTGFSSVGRMKPGMRTWGTDYPTTTIASIDTAGSAITLAVTAAGASIGALLLFDFGGDYIGSEQDDAFQKFQVGHSIGSGNMRYQFNHVDRSDDNSSAAGYGSPFAHPTLGQGATTASVPVNDGTNGDPRTSSETRAKNIYLNYIIKY